MQSSIVLKVNVPASGMQKMLRALPSDTIWNFKISLMERAGMKDAYNHGLLVLDRHGFRYLAESRTFADEGITADVRSVSESPAIMNSLSYRRPLISFPKPGLKLMRKRGHTRLILQTRKSIQGLWKNFSGALENHPQSDS